MNFPLKNILSETLILLTVKERPYLVSFAAVEYHGVRAMM